MQTTTLGPFTVGRIALGTMLMGTKTPVEESHRILDRFVEAGGTLVDTADVYSDGGSEETLAPWLRRHRDEVVLATKCRFAVSDPGGEGLAPDRIVQACDASLRRLGVDVIDLYQVHAPDPDTPLEETLEALDGLVRAGKVRALGASNFPAWLLAWAVATRTARGGRRSSRCSPSTHSSSGRSRPRSCPSAAPPGWPRSRGARSARAFSAASTGAVSARPRTAGSPKRTGRSRRPTTGARPNATSRSSTRRTRSPKRTKPPSRRSRSRGCSGRRA